MNSNNKPALNGLILFLSSGTYLGYIPLASGTFGTLWGLPIFYWLSGRPIWFQMAFLVGSILLAILLAGQGEKIWNKKESGHRRPGIRNLLRGWRFFLRLSAYFPVPFSGSALNTTFSLSADSWASSKFPVISSAFLAQESTH